MNLTKTQKLMAAGQLEQAESALPPADATTDPRSEIVRSRIRAEGGNLTEAIEILKAASSRFPSHTPLRLYMGIYFWDGGKPAEAAPYFDQVLAEQRGNDLARSYRALCYFAEENHDAAASIWREHGFSDNTMFRVRAAEFIESEWLRNRRFMGEKPNNSQAQKPTKSNTGKALARFYRRDFEGMLKHIAAPPVTEDLAAFLGATAHEMLRQYSVALTYLTPLESRRPEWPDPLTALHARLLTRAGHLQRAASEFSTVLIVGPEDYGVNYYLGVICLAYGKKSEARQYFLRAFTSYMVDTQEFQWWQLTQVLLGESSASLQESPTAET